MSILLSDTFMKSINRKGLSKERKALAEAEVKKLNEMNYIQLKDYLEMQNGKKFKGAQNRFKYKLDDKFRLFYTYGADIGLREKDKEKIVLLGVSDHEHQKQASAWQVKEIYVVEIDELEGQDELGREAGRTGCCDTMSPVEAEEDSEFQQDEVYMQDGFLHTFIDNHKLYVIEDDNYDFTKSDKFGVYLSNEQDRIMDEYYEDRSKPMLLMGAAGTGKTIVSTQILADRVQEDKKCVYFTQSNALIDKVKEKYTLLNAGLEGDVEFYNVNRFCLKMLGKTEGNLIFFKEFQEFLNEDANKDIRKLLLEKNVSDYDVWAEIRGTIKGGLDFYWRRLGTFRSQDYEEKTVRYLEKCNLIKRLEDKRYFYFNSELNCFDEQYRKDMNFEHKKIFETMIARRIQTDYKMREEREYMALSEEDTTLDKELREDIYRICKRYQDWLWKNGKYDENDLILEMLEKHEDIFRKYDFVVIDEIQDYTELQIYFIHKLVKKNSGMFMAGDVHQIVHPTMFREHRVQELYQNDLKVRYLHKNFRCQEKIVDYLNAISELRKKKIGANKMTEAETGMQSSCDLVKVQYSEENMKKIVKELSKIPGSAILVADENTKEYLEQKYKSEEEESIFFTVMEAKGLDYPQVFCFNLMHTHRSAWEEIIHGTDAKKKTKYRYYFNLLYVAASRAQNFLGFMEKDEISGFYEFINQSMSVPLISLKEFDAIWLGVEDREFTVNDWREQIERYKMAHRYKDALIVLKKIQAEEEEILACKMEQMIYEKNYEKAIEYAFVLQDTEMIYEYLSELQEESPIYVFANIWCNPQNISAEHQNKAVKLINELFAEYSKEQRFAIKKSYIEHMISNMKINLGE